MAGKKGRSGRKPGSLSWFRNPAALTGFHLNHLMEIWLAGVPIYNSKGILLDLPTGRRSTVPPRIKEELLHLAANHLHAYYKIRAQDAERVYIWSRRNVPNRSLRREHEEELSE